MLVAVASIKGSPFVTSVTVALAARWPVPGAVVVEADPAGGDLAFRFGHRREPGLSELAADTRAGDQGRDLAAYTQRIALGVDVVFAPADQLVDEPAGPHGRAPGQCVQVVQMVARNCLGLLRRAAADRLVVVDAGRLDWASPALPLVCAADVLLLATWPGVEAVDAVQVRRDRILALPGMRASVRLVVAGRPPCPVEEIAAAVGLPVAGQVPQDQRGAAVLAGRATPAWGGRGSSCPARPGRSRWRCMRRIRPAPAPVVGAPCRRCCGPRCRSRRQQW
ncbi:hypothetical protein Pflav_009040 [Phytohabitans flavus]|uniref:MinD-like ATPase involved in chromosome partitioning or flagellar assembly n=1 Tax=Phytohabitans flavus TaxID=1076124 RepID=A0A6F8XKZ8_9ACTN|nr:chromosome partitioning protein [Phytohabitans flavus]BCB74494.1 hypothetical protein Pflav_009040 [Phytohabitans flavus]